MEWLKVLNSNGSVNDRFDVLVQNGKYTVFTPTTTKTYKSQKMAQRFLDQYNLTIA